MPHPVHCRSLAQYVQDTTAAAIPAYRLIDEPPSRPVMEADRAAVPERTEGFAQ